jgi:hypothetical protein
MDEYEAYDYGEYESYDDALVAAKGLVVEFLEDNWEQGIDPAYLYSSYTKFGEAPVIVPDEPCENEPFSAWKYAEKIVEKICSDLEMKGK